MSEFKIEAFSAEENVLNKGLGRNKPNINIPTIGDAKDWVTSNVWDGGVGGHSFGGSSLDPSSSHSIWNIGNWGGALGFGGGDGGGGPGGVEESGGLSDEDLAIKKKIYGQLTELMDKGYNPYTGDIHTDRSPEELALLEELKEGGGYSSLYDAARKNLGFGAKGVTPGSAADVYKTGMGYGTKELGIDTSALMDAGSTYRDKVADATIRRMNEAATTQGMINRGHQIGGGAAWGDRSFLQDATNNQNFLTATGDVLGKMNLGAYDRAVKDALSLRKGREDSAGRYSDAVMRDLGLGTGSLDKTYATRFGAYGKDRAYKDRDLETLEKAHYKKENYPYKNLAYASGIYSGMPFDEKVVTNQPATGGK
jgi:hypothetical protein